MSSAGQIVGGLIGGVVGTFTPAGTFLGAQLGMMLGGYIDPGEGVVEEGPRLSDLTVQTSTYGAVIPDIHGTDAVSGNVFWLQGNKIDETPVKKKTGGKGGQKKTTVTWVNTATFAIGLCRGPVVGVRRIWLGGELYYDAGSSDPGTIAASNAAAEGFKVYLGTDTQDADPRIQADLGMANTPAWRGRAYIVFYDLDLAKYSGSLIGVQAKVEVMQLGAVYSYQHTIGTNPALRVWCTPAWNGTVFCSMSQSSAHCITSPDGLTWTQYSTPAATSGTVSITSNGSIFVVAGYTGNKVYTSSDNGVTWIPRSLPDQVDYGLGAAYGGGVFVIHRGQGYCMRSPNGITWTKFTYPHIGTNSGRIAWSDALGLFITTYIYGAVSYALTSPDGAVWTETTLPSYSTGWSAIGVKGGQICIASTNSSDGVLLSTNGSTWTRHASSLNTSVNGIASDGSVYVATDNGHWYLSSDGINWADTNLNPTVTTCTGPVWNGGVFAFLSGLSQAKSVIVTPLFVSGALTNLGAITSAKCLSTNLLTAGDIDVTQLTDMVRGYTDSSTGSIRDSLSPLQTAWPFDVRQRGYKLEFVRRGGASIRTIDANDLDARGSTTSPGVKITQAREMNLQLPRSVTVNHKDYDREYAVGEQYAERLSTDAVNEVAYELPVVMTASEAAQKADILLYLAWMERVDLSFSLPNTYLNLEPGDVISLPVNGSLASVRIVSLTYTSDGRIEVTGKFASASTYVSSAVGVTTLVTAQTTLNLPGASSYALMDVPTMHATQLDPSFLVSMYGATGWPGGVLLRSDDSGTTWADLQAFSSPGGTAGSATSVIGVVDSRVWDNASVLSVGMVNGDLFSVTAEAVLNGANYFAYGADGRWEIIGVKTCTLVSANTYNLSTILRGRFGTEWAMSTHLIGDKVVLLSDTDVTAIGVSISAIGLMRTYRGVTLDQDVSTATDYPFTYRGVNLKPLSPAYCKFSRDPSTNNCVGSIVRRTRYGGEWADNIDAMLSESAESYETDIFSDGSYSLVVRTINSSTPSVTYGETLETDDFGYRVAALYYKVYQVSATMGRGYPIIGQADVAMNSEYSVQITVPSTSVASNLTDYPLFIDLSLMSPAFWASLAYKDGRDIRVSVGGTPVPVDIVYVDSTNKIGQMFVKTSLSSTVATVIYVTCGLLSNGFVAPSDPTGRNAVWSNYISVVTFGHDHTNRVGSSYTTANVSTTSLDIAASSPNTGSHQGVAWDGTHYYVSGTNKISKYNAAWTLVASNTDPLAAIGNGTNHIGDIEVVNGIIYVPAESYTSITVFSAQRIARFSAETLAYIDSVSVSAQGHEVSSVAYCPLDGYLYVSSYADGSKLWRYNLTTLSYVGSLSLSTTFSKIQGVTWWNEAFWVSTGVDNKLTRVEASGAVRGSVYVAAGVDDDIEGVGHTNGAILLLVDSLATPNNGVVRTLVPKAIGNAGAMELVAPLDQFEYVTGLASYTTWTMGVSIKMSSKSTIMGVMSYTVNGSSLNSDRATIAYRLSSDRLGLWNDTDLWLLDTISPVVGTTYRINASHNGTSGRKFYRDGASVASAGSSTARPASGANALVMGMESWSKAEDFSGSLGFAYLAPSVFSDSYVAAESANLSSPGTFYSIIG